MREKEKTTVPIPSVGADGDQSLSYVAEEIVAQEPDYFNFDDGKHGEEYLKQMLRMSEPSYLPTMTMNQIYETVYESRRPIIENLLYPGAYLFVGAPKVGKSFFMAQLAYHVSVGLPLWDYNANPGTVLYLALEDDYRRIQERLYRMFGVDGTDNLHFATCAKSLGAGLYEQLKRFVREHPGTNLIIIDTLQKIREASNERYSYANDYEIIGQLNGIRRLYPTYDTAVLNRIASDHSDLILCMIKGFKPRGDDNRPDRGILPLAAMLASTAIEVMTYIYGPVIERNFNALLTNPGRLAASNGFWRAILALSDFVALDVPVLAGHSYDEEVLLDTSALKEHYVGQLPDEDGLTQDDFSSIPQSFHEDDVDTGIHFLFSHLLHEVCFEGMCNPPGGDWSGLSVLYDDYEVRWLSLPRVSEEVDGKRPDHVLELFSVFDRPVLLSIESKERSFDLEANVGEGLVNYIHNLMNYVPNVERLVHPRLGAWTQSEHLVDFNAFEVISAAAYLRGSAQANRTVFERSNCDMLFIMEPVEHGWEIEIVTATRSAEILKEFICEKVAETGFNDITLF